MLTLRVKNAKSVNFETFIDFAEKCLGPNLGGLGNLGGFLCFAEKCLGPNLGGFLCALLKNVWGPNLRGFGNLGGFL